MRYLTKGHNFCFRTLVYFKASTQFYRLNDQEFVFNPNDMNWLYYIYDTNPLARYLKVAVLLPNKVRL